MQARTIPVARTARYYTLGHESLGHESLGRESLAGTPVRELWMACHGYGQLAAYFLRHFRTIEAPGRLIVAPEALSRFYVDPAHRRVGASWMTREDREAEIDDQVRWLDTAYADALTHARPERLVAFGFSQGGAAVTRWLARSPLGLRCHRLVLWGSDLPHDLDLAAHRDWLDGRLLLVAGTRDSYATPERLAAAEARLREHAIGFETLAFDGEHRLDAETLAAVAERCAGT